MIIAPILFGVLALFTWAPRRRLLGALLASVVFAVGNVLWDVAGRRAGWWWYPGRDLGLWQWYFAGGLLFGGGFSLVALRVARSARSVIGSLAAVTAFGVVRDFVQSRTWARDLITFAPGPVPWLLDAAAWLSLCGLALAMAWIVEGARRGRSADGRAAP